MTRALRAFPSLLRTGFAELVAYRAEVVIWILTASMPVIMLLVWDRVAEGGPVGRFDQEGFARYFSATLVVRQLTSAWIIWELNDMIRTGTLSAALLKPMHPLVFPAAESLASMPIRVVVLVPLLLLIWLWRPGMGVHLTLDHAPLLAASIAMAWATNYLVQCTVGALAFWVDQSVGIYNVWFGLWSLFSGYLLPIELLPAGFAEAAHWLPFRAMLGVPVEIVAGMLRGADALGAMALQGAWLLVAWLVLRLVWARGLRRYGAFGA
ncbi:MAG: hypothetical protein AMXMBFR64_23780 [Myxococcales bacterium]